MKGTKAGHGELERSNLEVKMLGVTQQEGSGKTAVLNRTENLKKCSQFYEESEVPTLAVTLLLSAGLQSH